MSDLVGAKSCHEITYSPRDFEVNEIRILTLLPEVTEAIHCTLEHVSLINPPEYVALSYCWRDPTITTEIRINDKAAQVTCSLESTLRHLRGKKIESPLGRCSLYRPGRMAKRGNQLLWMGSIYRRAGGYTYIRVGTVKL